MQPSYHVGEVNTHFSIIWVMSKYSMWNYWQSYSTSLDCTLHLVLMLKPWPEMMVKVNNIPVRSACCFNQNIIFLGPNVISRVRCHSIKSVKTITSNVSSGWASFYFSDILLFLSAAPHLGFIRCQSLLPGADWYFPAGAFWVQL